MKIGVNACFAYKHMAYPIEKIIERVSDIGYDGFRLDPYPYGWDISLDPARLNRNRRKEIAALAKKHEVEFLALMGLPVLDVEIEANRRVIELASDLGSKVVNLASGGYYWNPAWRNEATAAFEFIKRMRQLAEYAGSVDVFLTIDNHRDMLGDSPWKIALMIKKIGSPAVKTNFDPGHYWVQGYDIPQSVRFLGPMIALATVKGITGQNIEHLEPDYYATIGTENDRFYHEGYFEKYVKTLREVGFKGYFYAEVEPDSPLEQGERVKITYQNIVKKLSELGLR